VAQRKKRFSIVDVEALIQRVLPLELRIDEAEMGEWTLPTSVSDVPVPEELMIPIFEIRLPFKFRTQLRSKFPIDTGVIMLDTFEQSKGSGPLTLGNLKSGVFLSCPKWSEFSINERSLEISEPLAELLSGLGNSEFWTCFNLFRDRIRSAIVDRLQSPLLVLDELKTRFEFDYRSWVSEWKLVQSKGKSWFKNTP
jgi:hypothetical protein